MKEKLTETKLRSIIKEEIQNQQLNEAKLIKDSIMFGGSPSVSTFIDIFSENKFKIWLNGGNAYEFTLNKNSLKNMYYSKTLKKETETLAINVAKFIEKEVSKLEKKYK
jgi:hypothetical protein